jgi:FAD/FMN-containing dehydrogenase
MAKSSLQVVDLDVKKGSKRKAPVFVVKEPVTPAEVHKKVQKTPKAPRRTTKANKKITQPAVEEESPAQKEVLAQSRQKDAPQLKREPLGHLLVEKLLKEAGFQGGISSSKAILDRYSNDESIFTIRPQIVLQPKNKHDVEKAVSVIARETLRFSSLSLTPRAAGTGLGGGSLTDSIMIDVCTHMHRIEEPVRKNGTVTITCEPGAMWRNVEKRLKAEGVYIPSFPASKDICSIGGSVANNAAGPDSLRYGHTANWVESVDITLYDGKTYTFEPITYAQYKSIIKKDNAHGRILKEVFGLIEQNEKAIYEAKPKTTKNSSGYALWDMLDVPVASFKKGKGTLNLVRLVAGSQGTIGILTSVTMKTEPIPKNTELVVVPVFNLEAAGKAILKALDYEPINIELFDGLTFDLALKNPDFFRDRLGKLEYYQVLLSMYTTYHVRYMGKTPEFTLLITTDKHTPRKNGKTLADNLRRNGAKKARLVSNPIEAEMFWQIRRASYSLSKFQDPNKRPAAFLEDMCVPAKNMPRFFMEIKRLLKKYNVTACVHGHGGNGHLHFYPLLDFENKATPALVMKMTEEFFATAIKFDGNLCGEHNDGIIRTPHLSKMFSPKALALFKSLEHIFDPYDIFNPGKKVNPRFDVKASIRHTNNNKFVREGKEVSAPL